jgi:hypothetical protein
MIRNAYIVVAPRHTAWPLAAADFANMTSLHDMPI